jgi:hypothetical protein
MIIFRVVCETFSNAAVVVYSFRDGLPLLLEARQMMWSDAQEFGGG